MKPKWVVEDFAQDNNYHRLIEEVKKQGYECVAIKYEPFQSGSFEHYGPEDCVIVQSSLQLASQLLKEKKWVPNAWLNLKAYECQAYYAHLGQYLFNDNYVMMPRAEVTRRKDWIYQTFGRQNCVFIRPSSGFKTFTGQVFDLETFDNDWQWIIDFTDPQDLVVISTPKNIEAEWRFVVANKTVVTGSLYRNNGMREYTLENLDTQASQLATKIAEAYQPDPVYVVDICRAKDGNVYLLEIGSFSCAGLYGCDMEKIVSTVSKIAIKEWEDLYNISERKEANENI
jgi:hypothetical protein